jgi:hypothetical protein
MYRDPVVILIVYLLFIVQIKSIDMTFVMCSLFEKLHYDFFPQYLFKHVSRAAS